jgi:ABC-type multidrug transport system ATPase subunit
MLDCVKVRENSTEVPRKLESCADGDAAPLVSLATSPELMKYTSSVFEWANVEYGVGAGKKSKEILKGISGSLNGGEVCAILGPSGSGKTSLLNVLANRIRHKGASQRVSGSVLLDGKKLVGGELRKRIAYVMQIDLLFATSTPREAIMFSATLRLPRSTPMSEKRELVEKMIVDMGLQSCANTFCGDDMIRGISGGEKKRTAIGIELVMKPQVCDGCPWTRSECASNAH